MGEPQLRIEHSEDTLISKDIKETILDTHTEEIIIGLCGPIGTDISFVGESFRKVIEEYGYTCSVITLSNFIKLHFNLVDFEDFKKNPIEYYQQLIDYGNQLREEHVNSILAELAINEITVQREIDKGENKEFHSQRRCFIIDSIKNTEELELFRLVYRELFYSIGVFSSLDDRQKALEDKGIKTEDVFKVIDRDSKEEKPFGQKVTDTFVESDLFLRIDKSTYNSIEPKIKRFCNLIFSTDVISPSAHETAMYLAAAAAGNSACLSRQVGASITDAEGEVISVGWNDVPKAGGSVYQYNELDPTSMYDYRCMNLEGGVCFNDKEKNYITNLLVNELVENGIVEKSKTEDLRKTIKNSKIKELIEFSRSVHAEMLAIIQGCQKAGAKIRNGKLYCTTYPCHNCARHIIASGIKDVYYIEPYRKSLALKLHGDSITEDESKQNMVRILMYEGVSPRRYLEFFKMTPNSRKENGKKAVGAIKNKMPKNTLSLQAIPILEKKVTEDLKNRKLINIEVK